MDDNTPDLREALDSAFDSVAEASSTPEPAPAPEPVVDAGPTPPADAAAPVTASERARDEAGRFAKKEGAPSDPPKPDASKPAAQPPKAATPPAPEKPAAPSPAPSKAPQSWKADAREDWAKLPPRVQQEVVRREREVQQALQESAEARQGFQRFREVLAPYEQTLRAHGADPLRTVQGLLQTSYTLQYAPPPVRAQLIAKMVQAYLPGREGLEMLDGILAGQPAPQAQPQQPQQFRDPRLDPILERLQRAEQEREVAHTTQATKLMQEISQEEFFEDVRLDMADILEMAVKRGLRMTPKEAYNRAVALHPEISRVMAQREAAKRAATPQGATQRARLAGSSVRPSPVTPPSGERDPGDLRADLEAAMSAVQGR